VSDDANVLKPGDRPNNFMPIIAVNKDGIVGLSWYDRRDNPDNLGYYPRFSASLDGGETWLPSVRISTHPRTVGGTQDALDLRPSVRTAKDYEGTSDPDHLTLAHRVYTNGGETAGLAADVDGAFHAMWIDNRTGPDQVWTAILHVQGTVHANGSRALAPLDDVSPIMVAEIGSPTYDDKTGVITVPVRLRNKSDHPMHTPLRLRVISLSSALGKTSVLGAMNGETGPGAVFDFDAAVPGGVLGAGESSQELPLRVRVPTDRPHAEIYLKTALEMDFRVLGKR
jgi:hypothetical protein